jgi:hypothetical protein
MNGETCKTKVLNGVIVQENGIIRNSKGRLLGRLSEEISFDSEHLVEEPVDESENEKRQDFSCLAERFLREFAELQKIGEKLGYRMWWGKVSE